MPHVDIKCFPRDLNNEQRPRWRRILPKSLFVIYKAKEFSERGAE